LRMFPHAFLLIEDGYLFVTFPLPSINVLNAITQAHLESYFGDANPSMEAVVRRIESWGLCHWRQVHLLDSIVFARMWRFVFRVSKVKATDYTGVKNR